MKNIPVVDADMSVSGPGFLHQATAGSLITVEPLGLSGSKAYTPGALLFAVQTSTTVTVTGAAFGDFVSVSFDQDPMGVAIVGYVSASDTVTVLFNNNTGGTVTLGAGTLRALVIPH